MNQRHKHTCISAAPRFRGIRALFARVSTRVRAALRSVATADAPAAGAAGKQPATAAAATAAEHAHHTSKSDLLRLPANNMQHTKPFAVNRRHVRHGGTAAIGTLGRGTTMRGRVSSGVRVGVRRRPSIAVPPSVPLHSSSQQDSGRSGRIPRAALRRRP